MSTPVRTLDAKQTTRMAIPAGLGYRLVTVETKTYIAVTTTAALVDLDLLVVIGPT